MDNTKADSHKKRDKIKQKGGNMQVKLKLKYKEN